MKPIVKIFFVLLVATTGPVVATQIKDLDPGDVVYRASFLGSLNADKVQVLRIDIENNRVKVRDLESGLSEWVDPKNLYTERERNVDATVTVIKAIGVIDDVLSKS